MGNENNRGTASGQNEELRYALSAEELQSIVRRALDEQEKRADRGKRYADDGDSRNDGDARTAGNDQSRRQSGFSNEGEYVIDAKMALSAIAKRWWIILLATLIGAFVMLGISRYQYTPEYQATIKLYVTNTTTSSNVTVISTSDIVAAQTLIPTYNEILMTRDFLSGGSSSVIEKYRSATGRSIDYTTLVKMLQSGAVADTQIYYVTVTSGDADQAIKLANIIYDELPRKLQEKVQGSSVEQIDKAESAIVVAPDFASKALIGAAVGFAISVLYAILVGCVLNDKLESAAWLASAFPSVPVLAQIPDTRRGNRDDYEDYAYGGYGYGYGYGYGSSSYRSERKTSSKRDRKNEKTDRDEPEVEKTDKTDRSERSGRRDRGDMKGADADAAVGEDDAFRPAAKDASDGKKGE